MLTIQPISEREFNIYALSLTYGPNFSHDAFHAAWKAPRAGAIGAVLVDPAERSFRTIVLRRQVDYRYAVTHESGGHASEDEAAAAVAEAMRPEDPPEPPSANRE